MTPCVPFFYDRFCADWINFPWWRETRRRLDYGDLTLGAWGTSIVLATTASGAAFGAAIPWTDEPIALAVAAALGGAAANVALITVIMLPVQVAGIAVGFGAIATYRRVSAHAEADAQDQTRAD